MSAKKSMDRREFMKLSAASVAGAALLAACAPTTAPAAPAAAPAAGAAPQGNGKHKDLPADAAPADQQVIKWMLKEDRYICSGVGGYAVMWDVATAFFDNLVQYDNDWNYVPG